MLVALPCVTSCVLASNCGGKARRGAAAERIGPTPPHVLGLGLGSGLGLRLRLRLELGLGLGLGWRIGPTPPLTSARLSVVGVR